MLRIIYCNCTLNVPQVPSSQEKNEKTVGVILIVQEEGTMEHTSFPEKQTFLSALNLMEFDVKVIVVWCPFYNNVFKGVENFTRL